MPTIKPTRMELLLIRKKLKLAEKGHKLLKEKRDVLIMEFFSILKDIKRLRGNIGDRLLKAQSCLYNAEAIEGELSIERVALGLAEGVTFDIKPRTVMSIDVPEITNINVQQRWHGYFEQSIELDNAIQKHRELFPDFIKLTEKQLALKRLAEEIKKTKRRVNSLEYLIMPKLEKVKKSITFKLEELERENFSRLKIIKKQTVKE